MTAEDPKDPTPPDRLAGRNKLISRLIILFFGALLLIYFVPLAWSFIHPR